MVDQLFQHITTLEGGVGILVIFGILLFCGLGLPLPEDIPLIAAGYLVYLKHTNFITAVLLSILGVLIGDTIIFWLGRHVGTKLLRSRLVLAITTLERIERVHDYYRRYGDKLVFFGRFLAGFRAPIFFVAGASHVHYPRFLLLDGLAALISVPVWIYLGKKFGHEIDQLLGFIQQGKEVSRMILIAVAIILVIYFVIRSRRVRNMKATKVSL